MKKTIRDFNLKGKRVLIRVDFNVPLDKELRITDDNRIQASLPTIQHALEQGAYVILMSHLGRPEGKQVSSMSLTPASKRLSELIGKNVIQCSDCVGARVKEELKVLDAESPVAVLENLRFSPLEEKNDAEFARQLAENGDIYINDAFGSSHRAHASIEAITKYLPSGAGFLLSKEIEYFEKAVSHPERPYITILGGAKVTDKIKLILSLMDRADTILIGGAMAYTFYRVMGIKIGNSKFEEKGLPFAEEILKKAKIKNTDIQFPVDRVISQEFKENAVSRIVEGDIPDGWMGMDIGPKTVAKYKDTLSKAKLIVWNGPMGVFEMRPFDNGTRALMEHVASLTGKVTTIIGGGDTAAAAAHFHLEDKMSHVSTGGGASLEYLEGTPLPGVVALEDKEKVHA